MPAVHVARANQQQQQSLLLRDSANSDSKLVELQHKVNPAAASRRLPTFLRIQESLTRKLNSNTAAVSDGALPAIPTAVSSGALSAAASSTMEYDDVLATAGDGGGSAGVPSQASHAASTVLGGDERCDTAAVMQQLADMTQRLSAVKYTDDDVDTLGAASQNVFGQTPVYDNGDDVTEPYDNTVLADANNDDATTSESVQSMIAAPAPAGVIVQPHGAPSAGGVQQPASDVSVVSNGGQSVDSDEHERTVISQEEAKVTTSACGC